MKKRLLAILLTVCMVISMAPAALAAGTNPFTDVSVDDWYYDEVQYVYENDLMKGTSTTTFSSDVTVNRAMMVTILYRLEGAPAVSTTGSFTDVPAGQYYTDAVEWAKENKITAGYGGLFGPNDLLTREQMATFFYRYAEFKGYDVSASADLSSYTDLATVGSYALDAFKWTNANGLIKGTTTTTLSPKGDATRGQLAVILYRFCENIVADAVETHTVTFDYNYSNKGTYITVSVKDGDKVEKPSNPTRSSYSFSGWYTKASGGSKFDFNTAITADLTLYARWSYNGGGGGGSSHSHNWVAGTPVAPTCTSQGYTPYTCSCGSSKNDDFVSVVSHEAGVKCPHCGVIEVANAAQLAAALTGTDESIHVVLLNDIDLPITSLGTITPGSGEYKLGGEATKDITIDLNGMMLNITTGYWSAIGANNDDAIITIKNGSMTSTGNSANTWNAYDVRFCNCNYAIDDVVFKKAVALDNAGKTTTMNKVTINDTCTSDVYGLWITAEGQNVILNECTINTTSATDGRGIKIDEQYVDAPVKVTLNVSNTTFKTEEKSAILVKSAAGADITLSNVNISDVIADDIIEVWVDEDSVSYYDLVKVTGGNKILEGTNLVAVKTADDLVSAFANLEANNIIYIADDINMTGKTIAPVTGNVGFTMCGNGNTISNLSTTAAALFVDHSGSSKYTFEDVVLEGCSVDSETNYGALFVGDGDTSDAITITNCHVKNCSVQSNKYAAAFVAYTAGYNVQNNGPVYSDVTIENCSVTGGSIIGGGSVGAAIGHAGGNVDTTNTITNFTVNGAVINGTDAEHTGVVVGTAHVGKTIISEVTYTSVTGNYNTATKIYGRFVPNATGVLIIDGAQVVTSTSSLSDVIAGAAGEEIEVTLVAGNYTLPSVSNGDVTISGTEDTVVTINTPNMSGTDVAFECVTIQGSGYATGVQHVDTVTYTNATIKGDMCLYGEKVVFNNCTFELNNQYIWTYGAKEVEFNNCTFNTNGKAILIYNEGAGASKVTVKGCTFNATAAAKASAIANQNCAAIEIDNFQSSGTGAAHTLTTEGNTYGENFSGEWRIKNFVAGNAITVNKVEYTSIAIDGKTMTIDSDKNVTVNE